ncbi:MAG: phenylacetate--CoA ligase [Peptococcaceae bacterium]|nr:phenylacetate--CoA ligase [Peptococcaceae bacterium]
MAFYDWETETMPLEVLSGLQLEKFRAQVGRVYRNAFLGGRYRAAGLVPGDIKDWDDLARVPFLTKDDLRENYPTGLLSGVMARVVRVHLTSGTTGVPVPMVYTAGDIEVWAACMARSFTAGGLTRDDVVQQAHGYGLFTGGLGFHYGLERVGACVIPTGSGNTEKQLRIMREWGTTVFTGTPTYALHVGEIALEKGIDPVRDLGLRLGFHGGEPCSDEMRRRIDERLGYAAHGGGMRRCYGLTEMGGPFAMDCEYVTGIHVWGDHYLMEVLDPLTLEPVGPGEPGELVLSNLSFEAMPFLRYRTGDRVTATVEPCPCGRTHPRITRFLGRVDDMLLVSGTNVFPSQVEYVLLQHGELSEHWRIVVGERKGLHTLRVQVEPRPGVALDESLVALLEGRLKESLSITCRIEPQACGALPRFEGKAVRVVDERSRE